MRTRFSLGLIAAGLLWVALGALQRSREAPDIAFTTITGEQRRISDFHGFPVLVTFWASDCRTCVSEIPDLDKLYREFSGHGFQLIAIAMHYDLPSRVMALVQSADVPYRVVLDPAAKFARAFDRVEWVPTTFLIAPDGTIRYRVLGAIDFATLRNKIRLILGES